MHNTDFDALKIRLASPEDIRSWSYGEVTKAETINYRTLKPEKDGLFDERIFGPTKDYECYCGKYKSQRYKGVVCDKCGVEVTHSRVRRERMGHIELASPVVHTWFFRRTPHKLPAILDIGLKDLESVIYFAQYLVTEIDDDKRKKVIEILEQELKEKKDDLEKETSEIIKANEATVEAKIKEIKSKKTLADSDELQIENHTNEQKKQALYLREELIVAQDLLDASFKEVNDLINSVGMFSVISEAEMNELKFWDADDFFKAGMGAEIILEALGKVDVAKEIAEQKEILNGKSKTKRVKALKRLKILKGLFNGNIDPTWIVLKDLPVIPPELRPMVQLPGGRFASSDLNDLYRRVINRNNRLRDLIQLGAPDIILQNEKRMLQEAMDSLIEGSRGTTRVRKELQSLSEMLKGKQGRFRANLLGKRVDYSGRSVIVVGPTLRIDQVGIPKEMALELFKPFVLRDLIMEGFAPNLKSAKNVLEQRGDEVWDILERVTIDHPVLLNRAPTLHRQNIQAFYPILIEGKAITFHPSIVGSFAGDFDGDQLAVHVPLSKESIKEAKERLLTPHNLLKLSHGQPIVDLKNEISLGLYYLTLKNEPEKGKEMIRFYSFKQAISAYNNGALDEHTAIIVPQNNEDLITTPGRIIFNLLLPEKLRFVNEPVDRDLMRDLIAACFDEYGENETSFMVDRFKDYGQEYATKAGASYSMFDFAIPEEREGILKASYKKIDEIDQNFQMGLMTPRERYTQIISVWEKATNDVAEIVTNKRDDSSVVGMMQKSKAFKVNPETIRQVEGMRGLMVDSQGMIKETPITTAFLEGQTAFEGFLNMIGGRKSLIDVALLTATAGYLTRRLADVAHDVIVREYDCGTKQGIVVTEDPTVEDWPLIERIEGRVAWKDIKDDSGTVLVKKNEMISLDQADAIVAAGITEVLIRSTLTCETKYGTCALCYGKDLATRQMVEDGTTVGVIAAQSIGEPGTQLTLHSKHRGGVAKKEITQGLPRVEELFEARMPKHPSIMSEVSGKITGIENESDSQAKVTISPEKSTEDISYIVPNAADLIVKVGDEIIAGDSLTEGYRDIASIRDLQGVLAAQMYLLREIQYVYKSQGVTINDKHIEIMIRKMSEKVRIKESGDSDMLPGEYINVSDLNELNETLKEKGKDPATGNRAVLGISKIALLTESWLSAASFEETTNVLASAALNERSQIDHLRGLKENVIIGRLIPTGPRVEPEKEAS